MFRGAGGTAAAASVRLARRRVGQFGRQWCAQHWRRRRACPGAIAGTESSSSAAQAR